MKDALAIAQGDSQVSLEIWASVEGLAEQSTPYLAWLNISVRSPVLTESHMVLVSLNVRAPTAFAVWGVCEERGRSGTLSELLVVGVVSRVSFTACDEEWLPVDHRLPSMLHSDDRVPAVSLSNSDWTTAAQVEWDYVGHGVSEQQPCP